MRSFWNLHELSWKDFGWQLWKNVGEDRVIAQSAQLAFYFMLSVFPLLLALTALAGLVLKADAFLLESLQRYLVTVAPESVSGLLIETLRETTRASDSGKLSLGLLFVVWAASNGMTAIIEALNIVYGVPEARPWWKRRLVALLLTGAFLLLLSMALLLLLYGPKLVDWITGAWAFTGFLSVVWEVVQWLVGLACILMAFNILYVFAPNVKRHKWHWLMPGTVAGVGLWLLASFAFKLYLTHFNRYSITYGSLGVVIILMLWFYLTGIAILVGAEVNSEIERECGKVPEPKEITRPPEGAGDAI